MVLSRHPKKYKFFMKTMLKQLVQHEYIITTNTKAKHLKKHGVKLIKLAKQAQAGKRSALNLLKGRVYTEKAQQKLLVNIIPRIKHFTSGHIQTSRILFRRRGDNCPMVSVSLRGNEKEDFMKMRKTQQIRNGQIPDYKSFSSKTLMEEKSFFEKKMQQQPENEEFFKKKIARIEHEQWILGKSLREPPRYSLLV